MDTIKDRIKGTFEALKASAPYRNPHEAPRIEKVVVSVGVGSIKDKNKVELIGDRLAKITGQKPATRGAKQSVASFKVREGDMVGYQVTLRGTRMYDFLDRLIHIALPRTKDFQGISLKGIDHMGNYTLGIKEHTIFYETSDEDIRDVFGMAITIVTTARNKREAEAFLKHIGLPFKK